MSAYKLVVVGSTNTDITEMWRVDRKRAQLGFVGHDKAHGWFWSVSDQIITCCDCVSSKDDAVAQLLAYRDHHPVPSRFRYETVGKLAVWHAKSAALHEETCLMRTP